jgi:hypothetical protein
VEKIMTNAPPQMSEVESILSLLSTRRAELRDVLHGLPPDAWNWHQGHPGLLGERTIFHLACDSLQAEIDWRAYIAFRLGLPAVPNPTQGESNIGLGQAVSDLSPFFERLKQEAGHTENLIKGLTDNQLALAWVNQRGEVRSVRWIIGHLNASYGQRLGQIELMRQFWEAERLA